ncbi:MAG: hypothetical protein KGJ62_01325 [Armatimonadetes bacterium]|nr:hypothetical protein [Armatimonadota bacterium]MDE2205854.1 hypothetical protein [Armatimonadota bacterium]
MATRTKKATTAGDTAVAEPGENGHAVNYRMTANYRVGDKLFHPVLAADGVVKSVEFGPRRMQVADARFDAVGDDATPTYIIVDFGDQGVKKLACNVPLDETPEEYDRKHYGYLRVLQHDASAAKPKRTSTRKPKVANEVAAADAPAPVAEEAPEPAAESENEASEAPKARKTRAKKAAE